MIHLSLYCGRVFRELVREIALEARLGSWKKDSINKELNPQHRILHIRCESDKAWGKGIWHTIFQWRFYLQISTVLSLFFNGMEPLP